MPRPRSPRPLVVALAAAVAAAGGIAVGAVGASAAPCSDVDVAFARGTGESPGLGSVGRPFVSALTSALSGYSVSSYSVDYAANSSQSSAGPGATDLSDHVSSVAAACPGTRFVIGGYSQGATVTDIAVGIRNASTSSGTPIPADLAGRVAAVVVFGNPLGARGRTIQSASAVYGPKSRDYCNASDSICGGRGSDPAGPSSGGHLSYASNGSTTRGGQYAADLVRSGGGGGSTPTPTPTATIPAGTCTTASTLAHVAADRATNVFGSAYAVGSRDYLGATSSRNIVSLRQTGTSSWSRVAAC